MNSEPIQPKSSTLRLVIVALVACVAGGVAVGSGMINAVTQQGQPAAFVAADSYRTFDSRLPEWNSKLVVSGSPQVLHPMFNTAAPGDPVELPTGTVAVTYNVTVTDTEGAGFLTIDSVPLTETATSNVNWTGPGQTIANSGITQVGVGDDQTLVFGILVGGTANASAHVIIDITGFFVEM